MANQWTLKWTSEALGAKAEVRARSNDKSLLLAQTEQGHEYVVFKKKKTTYRAALPRRRSWAVGVWKWVRARYEDQGEKALDLDRAEDQADQIEI